MKLDKTGIPKFRQQLLRWYQKNRRDLPFRKTKDPYKIWLSEIMLQQTTVRVVVDYYNRFVQRFPNPFTVAKASEGDLLHLWQGLGYYSRVRNFKAACEQVVVDFQGRIPQTAQGLKSLKGIGDYTAAAIASICFDEAVAVIDGNVKRVLARLFAFKEEIRGASAMDFFKTKAQGLVDPNAPGDFNQAIMELGALVCTPRKPLCHLCPVKGACLSFGNAPETIPVKKTKTLYIDKNYAALMVHSTMAVLLKPPHPDNLIRDMWELPTVDDAEEMHVHASWAKRFKGLPAGELNNMGRVRHSITNKRITADLYEVLVPEPELTKVRGSGLRPVLKKDLNKIAVNTLSRKLINKALRVTLLVALCLSMVDPSLAAAPKGKKSYKNKPDASERVVQSQIGLKIPEWGIAIDAVYNPELSSIIPGYHILNIVLTNNRAETIYFNSKRDKWVIIDNQGKRYTAYNHVKEFDAALWNKLPQRLQNLIDYPQAVSAGRASNIDVFVPKSVDLFNFREIQWKSDHFQKEFSILTNYEKDLKLPDNLKEFEIPKEIKTDSPEEVEYQGLPEGEVEKYPTKYLPPKIGEVEDVEDKDDPTPTFDPSLDDTIIIRE